VVIIYLKACRVMLTKVIFVVVTVEFGNYCCMFVKSKRHGGVIRKQQRAK